MSIDNEDRLTQAQELLEQRRRLSDAVAELADTTRMLLWVLPGGFANLTKGFNPDKDIPHEKELHTVTIDDKKYQASWKWKKGEKKYFEKTKLVIANEQGKSSRRVFLQSGRKLLALNYTINNSDNSITGGSIVFNEGHDRHVNNMSAVRNAYELFEELTAQIPDEAQPLLPKTRAFLRPVLQAA